jgi:acetyl-CoA carboxylase carboxyl transferase subunit alpha
VSEPAGGAHRDPPAAVKLIGIAISRHLSKLSQMKPADLRRDRERKFAAIGNAFLTSALEPKG